MPDPGGSGRGPRVDRMGDGALLVTLGDDLDLDVNARARRIADRLEARRAATPGLGEVVPGHASVLVGFDPDAVAEEALRTAVADSLAASAGGRAVEEGELHDIAVRYGGSDGPDLPEVAARTGLSEAEVVRVHAGVLYRVLVLGFVPGFPYLGILPAALELPRRATPRVQVPAGSVAIAGRQTGIYPSPSPGGWLLLGRTEAPLWNPRRDPPALLAPGDRVRFLPV
jgi:KipI family sensor histidine kinase inhibitor